MYNLNTIIWTNIVLINCLQPPHIIMRMRNQMNIQFPFNNSTSSIISIPINIHKWTKNKKYTYKSWNWNCWNSHVWSQRTLVLDLGHCWVYVQSEWVQDWELRIVGFVWWLRINIGFSFLAFTCRPRDWIIGFDEERCFRREFIDWYRNDYGKWVNVMGFTD